MSRYFVAPDAASPRILWRFTDNGRDPHVLAAEGWRPDPDALDLTMCGALYADEVGLDAARRIAAELSLPTP